MTARVDWNKLQQHVETSLRAACAHATASGRRTLAVVSGPWALDWNGMSLLLAGALAQPWTRDPHDMLWFWRDREGRTAHLALGACQRVTAAGDQRFSELRTAVRSVQRDVITDGSELVWWCGASFTPGANRDPWRSWPDAVCVLPRFRFSLGPRPGWTCCVEVAPGDAPTRVADGLITELAGWLQRADARAGRSNAAWEAPYWVTEDASDADLTSEHADGHTWMSAVAQAVADIRAGRYEKVVLARAETALRSTGFDLAGAILRLLRAYPDNFTFAVRAGDGVFIGSTPERLVRLTGRRAEIDCLAGTAARGRTPEEDERLGLDLLHSGKDRCEHAVLVDWVREALDGLMTRLCVPDEPVLRKLENVQHLYTPVSGELDGAQHVLDLVARLHPTPAVAGAPQQAALAWIAAHEAFPRGWYAGPIGWFDADGNGEFAVALRSALIAGARAYLYAGAGIVADSDPQAEFRETQWKLGAMRMALAPTPGGGRNGEP